MYQRQCLLAICGLTEKILLFFFLNKQHQEIRKEQQEYCGYYKMDLTAKNCKCVKAEETEKQPRLVKVGVPSTSYLMAACYRGTSLSSCHLTFCGPQGRLWQHRPLLPSLTETTQAAEGQVNYSSLIYWPACN